MSLKDGRFRIVRQEDILLTTIATFLIVFTAAEGAGPISASIARHAADARLEDDAVDRVSWSHLKRVAPATEIVITTDTADRLKRVFVSANDDEMTVINPATNPPCRAASALVDVARQRPELFHSSHLAVGFIAGDVDVRADRIFFKGTADCEPSAIIQRIPRANVTAVRSPRTVQSNQGWTVAGVSLGLLVGLPIAAGLGLSCDNGTVSRECTVGANLVVLAAPVAGGLLGHFATRRVIEKTYYSRDCDCE